MYTIGTSMQSVIVNTHLCCVAQRLQIHCDNSGLPISELLIEEAQPALPKSFKIMLFCNLSGAYADAVTDSSVGSNFAIIEKTILADKSGACNSAVSHHRVPSNCH